MQGLLSVIDEISKTDKENLFEVINIIRRPASSSSDHIAIEDRDENVRCSLP